MAEKLISFNVRVSAEEHASLEELRALHGLRSNNAVIRQLITEAARINERRILARKNTAGES